LADNAGPAAPEPIPREARERREDFQRFMRNRLKALSHRHSRPFLMKFMNFMTIASDPRSIKQMEI
jgi:hypothetical protein